MTTCFCRTPCVGQEAPKSRYLEHRHDLEGVRVELDHVPNVVIAPIVVTALERDTATQAGDPQRYQ